MTFVHIRDLEQADVRRLGNNILDADDRLSIDVDAVNRSLGAFGESVEAETLRKNGDVEPLHSANSTEVAPC